MQRNQNFTGGFYKRDELCEGETHCGRFTRRGDVTAFNMMDYSSCENCRHMTADNRCLLKLQTYGDKM